jgi:hypothetical protein
MLKKPIKFRGNIDSIGLFDLQFFGDMRDELMNLWSHHVSLSCKLKNLEKVY